MAPGDIAAVKVDETPDANSAIRVQRIPSSLQKRPGGGNNRCASRHACALDSRRDAQYFRIRSATAWRCSSVIVRFRLATTLSAFFLPRPAGARASLLLSPRSHAVSRRCQARGWRRHGSRLPDPGRRAADCQRACTAARAELGVRLPRSRGRVNACGRRWRGSALAVRRSSSSTCGCRGRRRVRTAGPTCSPARTSRVKRSPGCHSTRCGSGGRNDDLGLHRGPHPAGADRAGRTRRRTRSWSTRCTTRSMWRCRRRRTVG